MVSLLIWLFEVLGRNSDYFLFRRARVFSPQTLVIRFSNLVAGRCCIAPQPAQNQNSSPSTILSFTRHSLGEGGSSFIIHHLRQHRLIVERVFHPLYVLILLVSFSRHQNHIVRPCQSNGGFDGLLPVLNRECSFQAFSV